MAGGYFPKRPPDKHDDDEEGLPLPLLPVSGVEPEPEPEAFSDVCLSDAPILLLVYFHKAMREELSGLYRLANLAYEGHVSNTNELIVELRRRFDFLKFVHKYHSAVEDEVVFLALDAHIKNVVQTYSLEHNRIDDHFDAIFHCLNTLDESSDVCKPFQELLSCIVTVDSSIRNHMLKEEKQVFPLLIEHISSKEQALLVWQFFCSIPVILLEELLPWIISFLTPEKREKFTRCIEEVVPQEKSLQEVVVSWLNRNNESPSGTFTKIKNQAPDIKLLPALQLFSTPLTESGPRKKLCFVKTRAGTHVVYCLHLWHHAIQKDLKELLEDAYERRNLKSSSDIESTVVRLRFLADVIIFYSNALKKFFYPELKKIGNNYLSKNSGEQFPIERRIETLHKLLQCNAPNYIHSCKFVDELCKELESLVIDVSKQFCFQETVVLPHIRKSCSNEAQQQLLYMSLHLMPLGLLKCVIRWFAGHLSEKECRSFLLGLKHTDKLSNSSFILLLLEWFYIGYSGKASIESFGKNLHKIFKSRCSFIPDQIKEDIGIPSLLTNLKLSQQCRPSATRLVSSNKGKKLLSHSAPESFKAEIYGASYASEINLHIFFPGTKRLLHPLSQLPTGESSATLIAEEPKPVDLIIFFHKALKLDLEHLVSGSANLIENIELLAEFSHHFQLLQRRYKFHSETEDEIAFPALEGKATVQNISCSYSLDHEHEVKCFNEISVILEKMSKLKSSLSTVDSKMLDHTMIKYNQLSMKLHHTCKSMHKLLADHIHHEEIEVWSAFRDCFSIAEQAKIMGLMLGKLGAESLKDMIPWLIRSLASEEQQVMMSLWRSVTKNTMFDEWLGEWFEGFDVDRVAGESNAPHTADPLDIISKYLSKDALTKEDDTICDNSVDFSQNGIVHANVDILGNCNLDDKENVVNEGKDKEYSECGKLISENKVCNEEVDNKGKIGKPGESFRPSPNSTLHEQLLAMSQDHIETAVRRVSRDPSLGPQKKSYIIQNLLMSRWIVQQRNAATTISSDGEDIPGRCPSYRDDAKVIWGCKHYKRNCKLIMDCCDKIYTCIRCHDEEADHAANRRHITKMLCMKCLAIQPIGQTCLTASCNNISMAKYYCSICKLFDDEREIYHCPYCNLCRVGKGLGIKYFHCMNCNACMSKSLLVHVCREKRLEENCPICHEFVFTSSNPVKDLPCGHLMHSKCFREYTCTNYTCPICGKSLGDMRVYFNMLDALLAEEKIPDEYSGKTQVILCNDCEKKGSAPFHWHYHKCSVCCSYNTRLI